MAWEIEKFFMALVERLWRKGIPLREAIKRAKAEYDELRRKRN